MKKRFLTGMIMLALFIGSDVWSMCGECKGDEVCHEGKKIEKNDINAVTAATSKLKKGQVVITGTLLCTSCSLKKKEKAASQCSVYGCDYAVQVKKAINKKGKHEKEAEGKLYHILANDSSINLLQKKYKGKEIIVVGKLYDDERIIEIGFVKLAKIKIKAKTNYTCPMCGGDFNKSGKCPKCKMKLIEKK